MEVDYIVDNIEASTTLRYCWADDDLGLAHAVFVVQRATFVIGRSCWSVLARRVAMTTSLFERSGRRSRRDAAATGLLAFVASF
jgi:hypothetical protein